MSLAARGEAERRFVREALLALGSERPGLREAARGVRSWERALSLAEAGSVAESVWAGVSLRGLEGEIPEPARSAFQDAHADATARNALLLSEAAAVQAGLRRRRDRIGRAEGARACSSPTIRTSGRGTSGTWTSWCASADSERAERAARGMGARERDPQLRLRRSAAPSTPSPGRSHSPLVVHAARRRTGDSHRAAGRGARRVRRSRDSSPGRATVDLAGARPANPVGGRPRRRRLPARLRPPRGREKFVPRLLADLAVIVGSGAGDLGRGRGADGSPTGSRSALEAARLLLQEGAARRPRPPGATRSESGPGTGRRSSRGRVDPRPASPASSSRPGSTWRPATGFPAVLAGPSRSSTSGAPCAAPGRS